MAINSSNIILHTEKLELHVLSPGGKTGFIPQRKISICSWFYAILREQLRHHIPEEEKNLN
jgi:hypothetical protein